MRIHTPISLKTLDILRTISLRELARFLNSAGYPPGKFKVYESRLVAICLCQGGAQHYFDYNEPSVFDKVSPVSEAEVLTLEDKSSGVVIDDSGKIKTGIKDLDIWFFFREHNSIKIPNIGNCIKQENEPVEGFGEIQIDYLKKGIPTKLLYPHNEEQPPRTIIRNYLNLAGTSTAYHLRQKSIVGLHPIEILGQPIWTVQRILDKSGSR